MKKQYLKLGQLVFGVIVLLFFVYLFFHFAELQKILELLSKLRWPYLILLLFLEFLFILNRGQIFKVLYNRLGIPLTLQEATLLQSASYSVNVLLPTAGASGIALFMSQAENQGTSKTRALVINILFYLINYIALAALLVISAIYLAWIHELKNYFLGSFAILLFIILVSGAIILLAFWRPKIFLAMVKYLIKLANIFLKLFKIGGIEEKKSSRLIEELSYLKEIFTKDKQIFWQPFWLFILGNIYEVVTLYLIFVALGVSVPWMVLITVYSIGLLFMLLSITPSGVGIVEPIMAVVFLSSGIPLEASALAVLIFRAISFWLPLPFGVWIMKKYL